MYVNLSVFCNFLILMRIRIIFNLKNRGAVLPFHHQHLLSQLIKGLLLKGGNNHFFNFKFYHFSGLKGQTKVSRNGLHYLSQKVTLVLSSSDEDFIEYLLKQFSSSNLVQLGGLQLEPSEVELEKMPTFSDNQKLICISPIVLKDPIFEDPENKQFIYPTTDQFSDLLFDSTLARMTDHGQYSLEDLENFSKFELVPDVEYLQKLEEKQKKFARIYSVFDQDVRFEIRGYTFPFILYAAKEVQEFIYQNGLGALTHKGFGMVDFANQGANEIIHLKKIEPIA